MRQPQGVRPNPVDQLKQGEQELEELLPLTGVRAVPAARTREGKQWRANVGTNVRKRIVALTNGNVYPQSIVTRAAGLLRAFQNRAVAQGHDRWWITDMPARQDRSRRGSAR